MLGWHTGHRWCCAIAGSLVAMACSAEPTADGGCETQACTSGSSTTTGSTGGSDAPEPSTSDGSTSGDASTSSDGTGANASSTSTSTSTSTGESGTESSSTGEPGPPSSARHQPRPLGTTTAPSGYWEYLPPAYDEGGEFPLLVFWHGIGENGDGSSELDDVLREGPPRLIDRDEWPAERPFVVLSPQHPGDGCPTAAEIQAFFAYAIEAYAIDPTRVYLTGLSCGAIGGWNYLAQFGASQVAAAVLIAGDGRAAFASAGCALGAVPIWAFHGDADDVVSVQGTTSPIESLLQCEPPPPVQMTIYSGVGHTSWRRTYDLSAGYDIYAWLLE